MASSAARRTPELGALLTGALILLLGALAWWWQAEQASTMAAMGEMHMPPTAWWSSQGALTLLMWLVMMQAMMLPAALPVFLLYRRCLQRDDGRALKLLLFCATYALVWGGFAVLMTALQALVSGWGWLDPMSLRLPPLIGAVVLLLAGGYQMSQGKATCMAHCQSPLGFLQHHARPGLGGACRLGLHHGLYCVGCCWALMLVLLVVGAMSLWGMAGLALLVLAEKVLPLGAGWRRCSGVLLIVGGIILGSWALA